MQAIRPGTGTEEGGSPARRVRTRRPPLIVYIGGPEGKNIDSAKVGFRITAPDGVEQAILTMPMQGGYGADVILLQKGSYRIELKAVFGATTVKDELSYVVK